MKRPATINAASPRYRGRFAPSPTGPLHFGSLIAALASYCDARAHNGKWLVRIEDVDQARSHASASDAILSTLAAYGFQWDDAVVRQSERTAYYQTALEALVRNGIAFPCACTRKELSSAPVSAGGEHVYPGTCRLAPSRGKRARAWRAAVGSAVIGYRDRVQGAQRQRLGTDVGDFVIRRADGLFAYQLAVVVDDALQDITHVVRGADLLTSTPRQIWLQRELGFATPAYLHHAVAIDERGRKLSKQSNAAALPDTPLPALLAAWRFLDQPQPPRDIGAVPEFWRWAHENWDARLLAASRASR